MVEVSSVPTSFAVVRVLGRSVAGWAEEYASVASEPACLVMTFQSKYQLLQRGLNRSHR